MLNRMQRELYQHQKRSLPAGLEIYSCYTLTRHVLHFNGHLGLLLHASGVLTICDGYNRH